MLAVLAVLGAVLAVLEGGVVAEATVEKRGDMTPRRCCCHR